MLGLSNYFMERYLFSKHTNLTLRWGIAGITQKSRDFMSALFHTPKEDHKIIAIAAREVARAQSSANMYHIPRIYDDYEELALDTDIDIVFIGTINSQHFDTAMLMLTYGKHVLCESPMALNWGDTSELINYARSKRLFLMEAVTCRCFPAYDFIREELASRIIGDVVSVYISDIRKFPINEVSDMILDSVFHCLQFVCLVYNNEVPTITIKDRIEENGNIKSLMIKLSYERIVSYEKNRIANIQVTNDRVPEGSDPSEARIFGTHGFIRVPWFSCPQRVEVSNRPEPRDLSVLPELNINPNFFGFSYVCEATEVYTCIRHGYTESQKMTHNTSLLLAKLRDIICKGLNIWYS